MTYTPYTGSSESDAWRYLDKLETLNLPRDAHTEIPDVIGGISQRSGGLRSLVARYSNSSSAYVFGHVGGELSHDARVITSTPTPDPSSLEEIAELAFTLLENARWLMITPDCLMGILSSIHQITFSGYWNTRRFPANFYAILQRCLRFGGVNEGGAQMLQVYTLEILNAAFNANIHTLTSNFDATQIEWLREEAQRLVKLDLEGKAVTSGPKEESLEFLQWLDKIAFRP